MIKECGSCHKDTNIIYFDPANQQICPDCKTRDYPLGQFCSLCHQYIKETVVSKENEMFHLKITHFAPTHHRGEPFRNLTLCRTCFDQIRAMEIQ